MYCKKCGAPLDDDALFCSKCGQKIQKSEQTVVKDFGHTNQKLPRWIGISLFVFLIIVILGSLGEDTSKSSGYNSSGIKSSYSSSKSTYSIPTTTSDANVSTEYQNALAKGLQYANQLHMSKKAIYDQLTSSYGEGFPADAAQYAVDHMTSVDWNANALEKAKQYYNDMAMSKSAVYDQLVSEYGEQFTASQAQYAIDHLN